MKKIISILFVVMIFLTGCGIKGEFTNNVSADNPLIGGWTTFGIGSKQHYFNGSYQYCYEKYVFSQNSVSLYISTYQYGNWSLQESYPCTYHGLRSDRFLINDSLSCTFDGNTIILFGNGYGEGWGGFFTFDGVVYYRD